MHLGSNYRSVLAVAAMAAALCGCGSSSSFDTSGWFSKPLDLFGSRGGYTYSQLGEVKKDRPITANDLVDANGACPTYVPAAQAAPDASPDGALDATARLSGGIAIGMSECDVVSRVGPPSAVNLSSTPRGDRTAVLTFAGGPRPGVYRFVAGRLKEMDRVEEAVTPAPPPKKKKPAKNEKPKNNSAT